MQQQAATGTGGAPAPVENGSSLWIGDLHYWMNEDYLRDAFSSMPVVSTKVIRNKQNGQPEGYGFIQFTSHEAAEQALQTFNGTPMPNVPQPQPFRLNWACFGLGDRRDSGDHSIFVGDLAADVNDSMLLETFKNRYPSVKAAKVVTDSTTGRSKGYGFVRFGEDAEKNLALTEMNGVFCSTRPMRISLATPKKASAAMSKAAFQALPPAALPCQTVDDPTNTTIFVGNLNHNVSDEDLRKVFSQYGEISYVKIPTGRGCGFVQFTSRACAEDALQKVHGSIIGQQTVRLSWGRTPANKQRLLAAAPVPWCQPQFELSQWHGYYTYNQVPYDGYSYVFPQDPAFAYAGYQSHGTFPQQVN